MKSQQKRGLVFKKIYDFVRKILNTELTIRTNSFVKASPNNNKFFR